MPRPPLPLGSHGKITTWQEGTGYVARTKFRDYDGVVRLVKRNGRSKAAAERSLRQALRERQAPVVAAEVTPTTRVTKLAGLWFAEVERMVDAGRRSPGRLNAYRSIYRRHVEPAVGLPGWAVEMLRERRAAIGVDVEPVFPSATGGWRDPSNVLRVWREVRDELQMEGLVSHTMRKTVASVLDDAQVSTRKISDQLGHAHVSMTQDCYLGRRLTDRQTAEVLEGMLGHGEKSPNSVPGDGAAGGEVL
jgi:integrase